MTEGNLEHRLIAKVRINGVEAGCLGCIRVRGENAFKLMKLVLDKKEAGRITLHEVGNYTETVRKHGVFRIDPKKSQFCR